MAIRLDDDSIEFHFPEVDASARMRVTFHRTARVPDDGREYGLPAGFGRFPVRRVADLAEVPQSWESSGGVVMPMWQSEACWLSFDAEGKRLAFGFSAANRPEDAYVLDVADNRLEAWTMSETGTADPAKFVVPRLAQFATFDRVDGKQREIPVYVYEPTTSGAHPVLILLHGGPEDQSRPEFNPWIQFIVNELGYAVVLPNVRGSSGYGRGYLALDNGMLRDDAVKDVGALIIWIGLQTNFDAKHVVVAGGSYGGYLSLATMVNYSDRLRGGVDVSGIADFVSFLTNTAPYRQNQRRAEYGDERDPEMRAFLRRVSPLTNADRITKPLLVVHGKNDPRVPLSEAELIVNKVRAKGGTVWYLLAADEGHGYQKKQNRDAYLKTFAQFLTLLRE